MMLFCSNKAKCSLQRVGVIDITAHTIVKLKWSYTHTLLFCSSGPERSHYHSAPLELNVHKSRTSHLFLPYVEETNNPSKNRISPLKEKKTLLLTSSRWH